MESPSLSALDRVKVLVLGDVMLDRYWHGDATRISPEAPVPVVHVRDMEQRAGGAANVAVNVASLGASAFLLGVTGDDDAGEALGRLLSELGVDHALQRRGDGQTVTKLRILSRHQQLLRLDMEGELPAAPDLTERFRRGLAGCDAAVLSDYGKGTLSDIQPFIRLGREACVPVLVDPKGTEFTRYRGASVVTPNLREFEAVVGRCRDREAIAERAERLRCELDLQALLITRGGQGMTLVQRGGAAHHVPANDLEVYDVTGAGDTAIAVFATALGAGFDMPSAMGIANRAAGIVVTKLGTAAVSVHELQLPSRGVVTTEELSRVMQAARAAADTVVMTNGCFDILHAGHASYLERARALGDCLVVAVNDDDSVARLKGPGRPINRLEQRMQVLAALQAVDWVVSFSSDTPESLIDRLTPDVLVKGGDYREEQVAGAAAVRSRGGKVEIMQYRDDCSTSRIIEAAARSLHEPEEGATT